MIVDWAKNWEKHWRFPNGKFNKRFERNFHLNIEKEKEKNMIIKVDKHNEENIDKKNNFEEINIEFEAKDPEIKDLQGIKILIDRVLSKNEIL